MAWLAAFQAAVTSGPTQHRPETVLGSPQVGIKHSQPLTFRVAMVMVIYRLLH